MDAFHEIELTQAVAALRQQLVEAAVAGNGEELRFDVKDLTLEFSVELRKDAQAKAGFKAWVVSGDTSASLGRHKAHRVALTLEPRRASDGSSWKIGNQDAADLGGFGETR
ncbi:trypco2 family protein [Kitasatospora sp. NPDC094011]|uniref:trypco2 family protein n=1 Tax=Kitasatospora sp. NPDC094011 TaxID=3364090 RepID=UPI003808A173